MKDLTVIYYTANRLKENFAENVRKQLKTTIGKLPLISLSKKPMDFGLNICEGNTESSVINIYKALLMGAKAAKTKYVALAEDDTLYPPHHFFEYLPPEDTFAFNFSRWNFFTWSRPPCFSLRSRRILATLIAPRQLLIQDLEERFASYPDASKIPLSLMVEPGRDLEQRLGVAPKKAIDFYSNIPVVVFSHPEALGFQGLGKRKATGKIKAIEIPYWGRAEDVLKLYEG